MRRTLPPVLAVLALLAAAAPAHAQGAGLAGCRPGAEYEVCFNDPTGGVAQKSVLFRRLRALIDLAGNGDEVRVAMYSWTEKGRKVTQALVAAHQRGAAVAVVADSGADAAQLNALRAAGIPVSVCVHSCTSHDPLSIQHVKLFLLRIGGAKHTVVTTSNLTGRQRDELANDFVHSFADDELYDYYVDYWTRLYVQNWLFWGNAARVHRTSRGNTAMVFQRTDRDPVVRILRGIRGCTAAHGKVWVGASLYTRTDVRRRLARLWKKYHCDVRVVIEPAVVSEAFAQKGLPGDRVRKWPIHHKLLIIDATVGKRVRRVVYTGSHNFTRNALVRNDEIWTGYTSPFVFDTYVGYFNRLYAVATP
jgi:phosphatidylserine/phosphatidylglycerophosphate/cardiolipin synthase-like enzyme